MILTVIALGFVCVLVMCALLYKSKAHNSLKAFGLYIFTLLLLFSLYVYKESLGAPIHAEPRYQFIYVHHTTDGKEIVLWSLEKETGFDRLHAFPYDRETAQKLEQARQSLEANGTMMEGEFTSERIGSDVSKSLEMEVVIDSNVVSKNQ